MDTLLALDAGAEEVLAVSLSDGQVKTMIARTGSAPDGLVVDSGELFWTTMGTPEVLGAGEVGLDFSRPNGGVHAARLDGGGRRDVVPAGAITTPKQITTDGAGRLYWSDREGCRVSSAPAAGGHPTDLIVNTRDHSWTQEAVGVAVDRTRGHLYWTQKGPTKGGKGRIFRAGLALLDGEVATRRSDVEVLWDALPEPIDLVLVGDVLYWTDRGAAPRGNTLNRARVPASGARGIAPEILAGGFHEAIGLVVDVAAGLVYVSELGGTVRAVALPDGPAAGALPHLVVDIGSPLTGLIAG